MTNAQLTKLVDRQAETISTLTARIGQLVDELAVFKSEVNTFKSQVANDMQRVVENLKTNR